METKGLNAVTIYNDEPYFFLFADIDTKDLEELHKILTIFQRRGLSCYHYETTKGFHVISPTMLTIREWSLYKKDLDFLNYRFDTIRISKRYTDSPILNFEHFNKHFRRLESSSFHNLIRNIYGYSEVEKNKQIVFTKLQYSTYIQLHLKKIAVVTVPEMVSKEGNTAIADFIFP